VGIGEEGIRARVASGRLRRKHRGVYAVGHSALSLEGRCLAAVLAVARGQAASRSTGSADPSAHLGKPATTSPWRHGGSVRDHWGAPVSHRSAACLWGLLPVTDAFVDVIVFGGGGKARRRDIRVHRSVSLLATNVILRRRIPITTPQRTIADLRRATT